MISISANLNMMIKAAEKASKSIIRDFGEIEKLQVSKKGPRDFVTKKHKKLQKNYKKIQTKTAKNGFRIGKLNGGKRFRNNKFPEAVTNFRGIQRNSNQNEEKPRTSQDILGLSVVSLSCCYVFAMLSCVLNNYVSMPHQLE